ncbi:Cyclin-D1-binding protein 1-like [Mizuhopecten yessoensis]|uniref:Cyclin-D1-binding protein 1-like n=2 Tax=Mizuhopecten yessoensis TaxID=6573 RepID=A0A210PN67_MIZYE|nr:Cyclin-D1-binding protein 1-like [Mizuhopecten yessoensis]
MASGEAHGGVGNVLGNFKDNLELVITQIKGGETERESNDDFDAKQNEYWTKVGSVFKSLSHEATKLSLAFSSPPLPDPKTCKSLVDMCERATLGLVSLFYSLPKSQGLCLRKSLKSAVLSVLQDLQSLISVLHNDGAGSPEQLQSTGMVWQDRFSNLPKDNKQAVLELMKVASELVKDALSEMEEAVENGPANDLAEVFGSEMDEPSNEDTWSETDQTLLGPCLGLLKTTRSLLKKSHESVSKRSTCHSEEQVSQLDDLADFVGRLSPAVDEFAASLYPPMKYSTVYENVSFKILEI